MFGKGALIYVAGFSLVFAIYTARLSDLTTKASDNFNQYFVENTVHEAAQTAMNFAVNKVWDTSTTADSFYIYDNSCTTFVSISEPNLDTVLVRVNTHSRVFDPEYYVSKGVTKPVEDSIFAYFSYDIPASRYFWFTNTENGVYWIAGDTVWGPIHSNGVLKTNGDPVFYGKVTAHTGINPPPTSHGSDAHFYGGYEIGVDVELPTDMTPMETAALSGNGGAPGSGGADWNEKSMYNEEVWFEFLSDGDVIRTIPSIGVLDTVTLTDIAPTGVIQCTENVHVKGELNGQVSIHTDHTIIIENDITYADDPLTNPNSDDILGLVADEDCLIADNPANWADVEIQATIMVPNGSFGAENFSTRPVSGVLYLTGSVVQDSRGPVGTFTHSVTHGFSKRYYYDPRLQSMAAPYYPTIRELHLVSWWE